MTFNFDLMVTIPVLSVFEIMFILDSFLQCLVLILFALMMLLCTNLLKILSVTGKSFYFWMQGQISQPVFVPLSERIFQGYRQLSVSFQGKIAALKGLSHEIDLKKFD